MPRLNKIRISGNKYDGFQKQHKDSIFDLVADHSLFTLQNGSGKGVMLQLISQIMLPGTSWGRNNGNKIEGMFYNRYNVFKPYTFHVVQEWVLDNSGLERLVAGICVSARWQKSLDDSEDKVGLKYFLYTHKYRGESRYSLENLPLYSESGGGVFAYEDMKSFVEENSQDFRKYSKSSVSSLNSNYYQYLASHGIYRSEWEIMKAINRSEGGLGKYFSRAKDNQALFDRLIIPAISESINSRSQENERSLFNMFVDNIKIAENLPELISRREDITELLKMVKPLLLNAEHGVKLSNSRQRIKERGNNYLQALKTRMTFLENELKRSQRDKKETESKIEKFKYEEQNLKYARKTRKMQDLQQKRKSFEEEIISLNKNLSNWDNKEKKLKLNHIYISYQNNFKKYQQTKDKIDELKDAARLADLRQEINKLEDKIKKNWPELKKEWEESSRDIAGFFDYLNGEEERLEQQEKNLKQKVRELERIIDSYKERKRKLDEWKEDLSDKYNPLQLSTPSYLLEMLSNDLVKKDTKFKELKDKNEVTTEKIDNIKDKMGELKISLAHQEGNYQSLEDSYKKRKEKEDQLFGKIVNILNLDRYKDVYSQEWLTDKKNKLLELLTEKNNRLQDLNNKSHELEMDLVLNEEEYWIANYDQKRLYRLIKDMDIRVYYGSDFLINLSEDKDKLLKKYPLLPYSLVLMYENDWQKLKKNLNDKDIFRAPVPIYINYQLDKTEGEVPFRLVHGQEKEFIARPPAFKNWYQNLDNKQQEIKKTTDILRKKINNIRQLIFSCKEMLTKKASMDINSEMEEINQLIEETKGKIEEAKKKSEQLLNSKDRLKQKLAKTEVEIEKLRKDKEEIQEFTAEVKSLEQKSTEIENTEKQLARLEENLVDTDQNLRENTKLRLRLENDYQNWKRDLERFISEIKEIMPEVEFVEQSSDSSQQNYPQLYDYRDSRVNYNYQQLMTLQKKEEEKTLEIKYLRKEMDSLRKQLLKQEQDMNALDSNWESYSYNISNQAEIESKLRKAENKINVINKKIAELKEEKGILKGEIKSKKEEIKELFQEIEKRFQKTARMWPEIDLEQKELEIQKGLLENKKYLKKLREMIVEYREKIMQIKTLKNKLDYYQLDADRGEINNRIKSEIRENPQQLVNQWVKDYQDISKKLNQLKEKTEDDFYKFKANVNEIVNNDILRTKIKEKIIQDFRSDDYSHNYQMLSSFKEYLHNELNRLAEDKSKAERARKQWAERSAMHIMRIVTSLKDMINNMVYHNQRGYSFPLVRLRRKDLLPEKEEEIIPELKEYFVEVIEKFKKEGIEVDRLTDSELKNYTGNSALFSRAIRGRYPVLQVYKMTEKNEFKYARPEDYYYADWESVIQGKSGTREGSGGQSLSINAFMMMMLLNYKKQRLDQTNPWTVLFLDNPFGKASAAHVLDPVFEIADKLNFQLVAFAAPEIIKTEISERFPVFWALEITNDQQKQGVVSGQVIYGERIRKIK